jgi:metal-dependent amidase/aminoacylase/carboxypeptidase family protein
MFQAGEINNAFPEKAYLSGTARFFNRAEGQKALELIKNVAVHTAACHKCAIEFNPGTRIKLQPVVNDEKIATRVQAGLSALCGSEVLGDCKRWYASESYSRYLEKYPGVLIFLGITNESLGSGAPHHNGRFDVDESVLPLGVCAEVAFVLS